VEHFFTVPLDHGPVEAWAGHNGREAIAGEESITVFAREYTSTEHSAEDAARLPWLLYLQGGPGGRGNRVTSLSGWMKAAAKDFRILMLDQRGTGLSTPIEFQSLARRGDAERQAEYLAHFRADSIVADAEMIRRILGAEPWTVLGQSFGGFCALTYLSFAPEGLREVLITGIPKTAGVLPGSCAIWPTSQSTWPAASGSPRKDSRWWAHSSVATRG
jgi:proline iminopeptidase